MVALTVAVVVLTVLVLANLLLTFGVVRRLSAGVQAPSTPPFESELIGRQVPSFELPLRDGGRVTGEDLAKGRWVIGFMSGGCDGCLSSSEKLGSAAGTLPDGEVLGVVADDGPLTDKIVERLGDARIAVVKQQETPMFQAFEVAGFPLYFAVVDGLVVSGGYDRDAALRAVAGGKMRARGRG